MKNSKQILYAKCPFVFSLLFSWCHFTQRNSLHFVVAEVHIGTIVISSIRNTERETWCAFLDMKCPQSNAINKHVFLCRFVRLENAFRKLCLDIPSERVCLLSIEYTDMIFRVFNSRHTRAFIGNYHTIRKLDVFPTA